MNSLSIGSSLLYRVTVVQVKQRSLILCVVLMKKPRVFGLTARLSCVPAKCDG